MPSVRLFHEEAEIVSPKSLFTASKSEIFREILRPTSGREARVAVF